MVRATYVTRLWNERGKNITTKKKEIRVISSIDVTANWKHFVGLVRKGREFYLTIEYVDDTGVFTHWFDSSGDLMEQPSWAPDFSWMVELIVEFENEQKSTPRELSKCCRHADSEDCLNSPSSIWLLNDFLENNPRLNGQPSIPGLLSKLAQQFVHY